MILRKPYALLIKHFKKIHIVLFALMAYLAYGSNSIASFFREFVVEGNYTRTTLSLSQSFVPIYLFIATILVSSIAIVILILMRQKKKPTLFYMLIIGLYIGLIFYFFYISGVFNTIEIETMDPRTLRVIRDMASIITFIQYGLLVLVGIRAVGFDIKKFNFGEDLAELEIDVSDNEEFELTVGLDPDKVGRSLRRRRRELKYFIVENLFVFILLSSVTLITLVTVIVLNIKVYNRIYSQGEPFRVGNYVALVNDTYITNLDKKGAIISSSGKKYAVLNIAFNNVSAYPGTLVFDDISLINGNNIYKPVSNFYESFIDLGEGYRRQNIKANETRQFIFVFELNSNADLSNLYLRYINSLKFESDKIIYNYKRVKLHSKVVDKSELVKASSLENELTFQGSPLKNSSLLINNYQVEKTFSYDGKYCINSLCNNYTGTVSSDYTIQSYLLKLSYTYTKGTDVTISNTNNLLSLIDAYGFIRYKFNNKVYTSEVVNKTPTDQASKDAYLQVPYNVKNATTLELVIRIREKEFIYNLK